MTVSILDQGIRRVFTWIRDNYSMVIRDGRKHTEFSHSDWKCSRCYTVVEGSDVTRHVC